MEALEGMSKEDPTPFPFINLRKTWWNGVKEDMKNFCLAPKDTEVLNK